VLTSDITVAAGTTWNATVQYCCSGQVAQEKIGFSGTDTLTTVVSLRTLEDRIGSDTVGIILVATNENTRFDN
jgi:hypothetical protein